jgi:NAD(P)-dependent dehydrogenase (short-subunit alcohol dehydrogenase family)
MQLKALRSRHPSKWRVLACVSTLFAPGPIETPMLNRFTRTNERKAGLVSTVPLKRVVRPEEIAQTIAFISSDKASFITSAYYLVDGGKTAQ